MKVTRKALAGLAFATAIAVAFSPVANAATKTTKKKTTKKKVVAKKTTAKKAPDTVAPTTAAPVTTAAALAGAGQSVGLLFDITGRGDKSFNDAAAAGLDKAKAEFTDTKFTESAPTGDADRPERVKTLIAQKTGLIVCVGFLWTKDCGAAAKANPVPSFAIIDDVIAEPNAVSLLFSEEQGSFLVGYAAALKSKSGKVGFIGGVRTDRIGKFEAGYTAGVQAANAEATVEVKYATEPPDFSGFNDPAKGKTIAKAMFDSRHRRCVPRCWWNGCRPVHGRQGVGQEAGRDLGHRRRQRPVPVRHARKRPGVHPDFDAEACRRRHLRGHQGIRSPASRFPVRVTFRPQAVTASATPTSNPAHQRHQRQAGSSQGRHHLRQDRCSDEARAVILATDESPLNEIKID